MKLTNNANETRNLKPILKHSQSRHNIKLLRSVRSSNRLKLFREEKSEPANCSNNAQLGGRKSIYVTVAQIV